MAQEWDNSRHIYDRSWDSLSDVQRESAGVLGYNKNKWNRCGVPLPPPSGPLNAGKMTFLMLCSDRYVRADDLYWKQLNDKQRKAARVLGFKQQEWDRATRAGSHSKDIDMERKRNLRKTQSKTQCDNNVGAICADELAAFMTMWVHDEPCYASSQLII